MQIPKEIFPDRQKRYWTTSYGAPRSVAGASGWGMSTAGKWAVEDAEKWVKMQSDSLDILWVGPCREFPGGME